MALPKVDWPTVLVAILAIMFLIPWLQGFISNKLG